jgi:hypothetical protein
MQLFPLRYFKDRVYRTNLHALQQLQADIDAVAEDITGDMLHDTDDNLWFVYGKSTRLKDLILNISSHEDHMHTNSP